MTSHRARIGRRAGDARRRSTVLLTAFAWLGACGSAGGEHEEKVAAAVRASTAVVDTSTFLDLVEGSGLVAARAGYMASLSATTPTRILRVYVTVGDRVSVGAPLVEFDAMPLDATLRSAEAALAAAEQASARATRLVAEGLAPRRDVELAAAELAAAQAAASSARRARQLATLSAPIAGVVSRVAAVLGANVDVGQPLVDLVDPSYVDVMLQFPPDVATRLRVGQLVSFSESAGDTASVVGTGRVAHIAAVVDSGTRAVSVGATLDAHSRPVRVGEVLFGQITVGRRIGVTVIPDDALVPFEEGFRVFVVDSASIAHARSVSVGGRTGHRVWVTDGLKAGEMVVTAGAYGMDDGATVINRVAKGPAKP